MTITQQQTADDQCPVADPGLEEHTDRWSDVDQSTGNRAYRQVVTIFALSQLLAVVNVVLYFAMPRYTSIRLLGTNFHAPTLFLGLTGGFAVLLIGIGAIHWARQIMSDEEIIEERHAAGSSEEQREGFLAELNQGIADSGVGRRKLIVGGLGGALGLIALPALVTLLDVGPWPTKAVRMATIERTIWAEGTRILNDTNYKPLKATDLEIGQLVNAQPETLLEYHGEAHQVEKAKSALIVVRMDPNSIKIPESRRDWQVGGILAYSKICTHVGCPISLWEQQTHHLLCPCHQSTFDLGNSGVVVFGPAGRALPQLPITVDAEGYLVSRSDFTVPVGPSYFERDSRQDYKDGDR